MNAILFICNIELNQAICSPHFDIEGIGEFSPDIFATLSCSPEFSYVENYNKRNNPVNIISSLSLNYVSPNFDGATDWSNSFT